MCTLLDTFIVSNTPQWSVAQFCTQMTQPTDTDVHHRGVHRSNRSAINIRIYGVNYFVGTEFLAPISAPSPGWFLWVLPPPENCCPPRDQTGPRRDLPRTIGVGVILAYGAYATVNAPLGAPRKSVLVTGPPNFQITPEYYIQINHITSIHSYDLIFCFSCNFHL